MAGDEEKLARLAPTDISAANLEAEGVPGRIHVTGNTGIDALSTMPGVIVPARLATEWIRAMPRKAGDVIPEVVGPVLSLRPADSTPWVFPTTCPRCGNPLVRPEGESDTRCVAPDCPAQRDQKISYFASRGAMDIEGLGEERHERIEVARDDRGHRRVASGARCRIRT